MKKLYFLFLVFSFFTVAKAQNPADIDPSFNQFDLPLNHYFVDSDVKKTVVLPDGKILLMKSYKKDLVRLQGNLIDPSFNTGTGFTSDIEGGSCFLTEFAVQPDGKIIVAGYFNKYNGVSKSRLLRLNPDGSLDTSFTLTGFRLINEGALRIEVLPDGKILLLADLTSSGGSLDNLKRLNSDGSVDNSFVTIPNYVFGSFAIQPDGKLIVAHNTDNDRTQQNTVSRLNADGSFDPTFTSATFSTSYNIVQIRKLLILNNGKIVIGGQFSGCNSQTFTDLVQLNANGSVDTSFNVGGGFVAETTKYRSDYVNDIVEQNDGKLLVGGRFYQYNGVNKLNFVRLNTDGTLDTYFSDIETFANLQTISCVNLFQDQKILVSGSLGYNKKTDNYITKVNTDGTKDTSFNNICKGFFKGVNKLVPLSDGKILVGGSFHSYNGSKKIGFARLNNDGSIDNSLNYGGGIGFEANSSEGIISAIAPTLDGKIYISGKFTTLNGQTARRIVRVNSDGTRDTAFNTGYGIDYRLDINLGDIKDILALPNGYVLVAGNYNTYNDRDCSGLLILSSTGERYGELDVGNNVTCLKALSDGSVLLGLSHLESWNYSLGALKKYKTTNWSIDQSFVLDPLLRSGSVTSIEVQQDDKILLCGEFVINGVTQSLVRILNNGSIDTTFNFNLQSNTFLIKDITLLPNQKIVISYITELYSNIIKLIRLNSNGTVDTAFNQKTIITDGGSLFLNSQSDGKIYVYGSLLNSVGNPGRGVNRLLGEEYNFMQGQNKFDAANNGCDLVDTDFTNLKLHIATESNSFDYITNITGNYNAALENGKYSITPTFENPTYFTASPATVNVTFPTQTSPFIQNFCITPNGVRPDLEVTLLPLQPARPGFDAKYKVVYKNKGNTIQSGSVNLGFTDSVLDLVVANPVATSQITNTLSWNFTALQPFETREITLTMNVNSPMEVPAVNNGDILAYTATITSSAIDETPTDNTFAFNQTVVGSYDPNDKTCLEGSVITPNLIGQYVHYTIRFENTGTFAAENVVVKDMIDLTKFDISTLVPTSASHSYTTRISEGNKVEFIFENINLPFDDANNDGYIAFKIKTKSTLVVNDSFSNEASIFFDYNFPIVTNKATSTFKTLGTQDFDFDRYFTVYPNPATTVLNITTKESINTGTVNVYNTLGQLVLAILNAEKVSNVDVSNLKSGNYFIQIKTDKGSSSSQFVKD